jgi:hypothetical protein
VIQHQVRRTEVGPGRVRYRTIVTGEDCGAEGTHESRIHFSLFLNWIADNQHMLNCGYSIPQKLRIVHTGTSWQAEAEAEVDEATE